MARRKWLSAALGVVLVGSLGAPMRAHESATDLDRMMYVTFNRPVTLPGVTLGSGTYIFELADPISAWDLVRVSSRDRRVVYLTAFTQIVDRPHEMSPDQPISFGEAAPTAVRSIQIWWPAGQSTGRQFIY